MKEVPLTKHEFIISDHEKYSIHGDLLVLYISTESLSQKTIRLLNSYRGKIEIIPTNYDYKTLNKLLCDCSNLVADNNIVIYLSGYNKNLKIRKNEPLLFGILPSNIKIDVCSHVYPAFELQTWFLNLSDKAFLSIYDKIYQKEQADNIRMEREIAKNVYSQLLKKYDFSKMTATEKMNIMYRWVRNNFEYDVSLIQADGNYKEGIDISLGSNPIKVFTRGKGVCTGRSRLLAILLNNPYMNVECYTVDGEHGTLQHEWNEFIDENGQVWEYDLSYGEMHEKMEGTFGKTHIMDENSRNFAVKDSLTARKNSGFSTPPLPQRKNLGNSLPPLPPRKDSEAPSLDEY